MHLASKKLALLQQIGAPFPVVPATITESQLYAFPWPPSPFLNTEAAIRSECRFKELLFKKRRT